MDITLYMQEVQNWIKEIQSNRGKDPERLIMCCDKIEDYGRKIHDNALIGFACFSRGETYYLMNDTRNFYAQMLASLTPMEKIGEWGYVVMANNMLGIMSLNRGNAPFAMDYYMKAMSYCQQYRLPDLEWIVHMNIGALYLNIEEYAKALDHLESGYHYIMAHPDMEDYIDNLTTAYLGMAKAYLRMDMLENAEKYNNRIEKECKPYLTKIGRLVVACFQARIYQEQNRFVELDRQVTMINQGIGSEIPIMDIFDDLYDYMVMLLDVEKYDEFMAVYQVVEQLARQTTIKNMEKKLLTLLIRYYRSTGQTEAFQQTTVRYFEVSELMEKENRLMVNNMISMRNSLNNLAQINWEVEQENIALHKKSETDPLTGLSNRFKLNEYGEEAFSQAYENQTSLAIEILDIDYFKEYNDNYGHQAGDAALQMVSRMMLQMQKYGRIFCARYGGDEFVIIYEGFSEEQTRQLADELKAKIVAQAIEHKYSKAAKHLTISQGICWGIPKNNDKVWDYLHAADEFLYKAKKVSRNSVRIGQIGDVS